MLVGFNETVGCIGSFLVELTYGIIGASPFKGAWLPELNGFGTKLSVSFLGDDCPSIHGLGSGMGRFTGDDGMLFLTTGGS